MRALALPRRRWATFAILLVLLPAPAATEQDYLAALSVQLEAADVYLDDAADALNECADQILTCYNDREPYAQRVETAGQGLDGILTNLSAMEVPDVYASDHLLLRRGFEQVIAGLVLYAEAIRAWDTDQMYAAGNLTQLGRSDIRTASGAILQRSVGGANLPLILGIATAAEGAAIAILVYLLVRRVSRTRRQEFKEAWATCPLCGEVVDQWWRFRKRVVREWHMTHLRDAHGRGVHSAAAAPSGKAEKVPGEASEAKQEHR